MDLNALALFSKIIECNSFSAAAKKTGVSTSSISRKISQLEASLNIQLIERTTRKLRLTEKGRIFFENIQPAIQALNSARLDLLDNNMESSGTLRLSVPNGLEESVVIPLLSGFQHAYPDICLKVLATSTHLKFVEDGIDIALRVGELQDCSLIAHSLLHYEHILVASPEYAAQHRLPCTPAELSQHKIICATNWHNDAQWFFNKNQQTYVFDINESLSLNHYAAILSAAEKSMGIAELPSINCKQAIDQGRLIGVLPDYSLRVYDEKNLKLSIVYTANRYNSRLIKIFKHYCLDHFNKDKLESGLKIQHTNNLGH